MMKKKFFVILAIMVCASTVVATAGTKIACDLAEAHHVGGISEIKMVSGDPGYVQVSYLDGTIEKLIPVRGVGGIFDQIRFSSMVLDENSSRKFTFLDLDTRNSKLASLQIGYACNQAFTTFCKGFGGNSTPIARVNLNIDGQVVRFDGANLSYCTRQ